jgi:hypothetical protein
MTQGLVLAIFFALAAIGVLGATAFLMFWSLVMVIVLALSVMIAFVRIVFVRVIGVFGF